MSTDAPRPTGTEVIAGDSQDEWQAPAIALPSGPTRYAVLQDLARGSMGAIKVAKDPTLERLVALKVLDPAAAVPNAEARFLDEARITAQLQHPSVVAVHAIDTDAEGRPYFTMQLIEGRTLRDILDGLARGEPDDVRRFGRARLLGIVIQICNCIAYAHSRGVLHRDLKPENVMLGEFGEVFVMDWGLAKIVRADVRNPVVGGRPDDAQFRTRAGDVTGTPAYMPPEQALGLVDALSTRSDIFSIGAILYEILTLRPPFVAADAREVLRLAQRGAVVAPSEVAPDAEIPPILETLVMTCLARDPTDRPVDAAALRDELESCLTGGGALLHQVRATGPTLREAARASQLFRDLARRRRRLSREALTEAALRLPFDPLDEVEAAWAQADRLRDLEVELEQAFEDAVARFHQVLAEEPAHASAHDGLRDLLWYRFLEAERFGDEAGMTVFRSLAQQHDRRDLLRPALQGDGSLTVYVQPPEATLRLERQVVRARRLVGEPAGQPTPGLPLPVAMGSYVLVVEAPGHEPQAVPLLVARQEPVEVTVSLVAAGALPPGLALVPGGPFLQGTRAPFVLGPPVARVQQPTFLIARTPVTVADYADFVNDQAVELRGSLLPSPWPEGRDGRVYPEGPDGTPMTGLTLAQVRRYLTWRRERDGLPWRLPTAAEWEKAGRGVDGRAFPWGDVWEPGFCRCVEGPEGGAPSPVGSDTDRSPYGVQDLAGGVREWTSTEHPRDPRRRAVKGGSFAVGRAFCHLGGWEFRKVDQPSADVGFRLALDASAVLADDPVAR
ncbi:MAG: SUMF1/EgtB/PvdO family nonheme iron enzyme [Myxococcales bacterium]|nr:SUMF1/EgtB/PvdO family nonheme iron enzyme [Myxococcales bacterium]